MAAKKISLKETKGLLGRIASKDKNTSAEEEIKMGPAVIEVKKKDIKWRKVTIRFEEGFFLKIKDKIAREGRTLQGYISYLVRRDMEKD